MDKCAFGARRVVLRSRIETTFWSGACHALVAPVSYNDADRSYRGQDGRNHTDPGLNKYTSCSIWDIYRGEFPDLTLTKPKCVYDIVHT